VADDVAAAVVAAVPLGMDVRTVGLDVPVIPVAGLLRATAAVAAAARRLEPAGLSP